MGGWWKKMTRINLFYLQLCDTRVTRGIVISGGGVILEAGEVPSKGRGTKRVDWIAWKWNRKTMIAWWMSSGTRWTNSNLLSWLRVDCRGDKNCGGSGKIPSLWLRFNILKLSNHHCLPFFLRPSLVLKGNMCLPLENNIYGMLTWLQRQFIDCLQAQSQFV